MNHALACLAVLGCVLLPGCHHGGSSSSPAADVLVTTQVIGPSGGTLLVDVPGSPYRRTRLEIPAGALAADVPIELWRLGVEPGTLSEVYTFELRPLDVVLAVPARLTIRVSPAYLDRVMPFFLDRCFPCGEEGARREAIESLALFFAGDPRGALEYVKPTAIDADDETITGMIDGFGRIFAVNPFVFVGMHQARELIDPADPLAFEILDETFVPVPNGTEMAFVGKGSLASFWSSSSNALVIPGLGSNPLNFMSELDLIPREKDAGVQPWFDNVVAYQYPSTRSIAANANWLYDRIKKKRRPGFRCTMIVHSMGGLVARYLIEQSHADPERPGFEPGDPPLDQVFDSLVTIATPHRGASLASLAFGLLLDRLPGVDLPLFQGVEDLGSDDHSFTDRLNDGYRDNATRYDLIAGNVFFSQSDGVVSVDSALGVPLTAPEDDHEFGGGTEYSHVGLHEQAATNGVLERIRKWLGK